LENLKNFLVRENWVFRLLISRQIGDIRLSGSMLIEELGDREPKGEEIEISENIKLGLIDAKRAAVGVGGKDAILPHSSV
jgi:hypothetical protein